MVQFGEFFSGVGLEQIEASPQNSCPADDSMTLSRSLTLEHEVSWISTVQHESNLVAFSSSTKHNNLRSVPRAFPCPVVQFGSFARLWNCRRSSGSKAWFQSQHTSEVLSQERQRVLKGKHVCMWSAERAWKCVKVHESALSHQTSAKHIKPIQPQTIQLLWIVILQASSFALRPTVWCFNRVWSVSVNCMPFISFTLNMFDLHICLVCLYTSILVQLCSASTILRLQQRKRCA